VPLRGLLSGCGRLNRFPLRQVVLALLIYGKSISLGSSNPFKGFSAPSSPTLDPTPAGAIPVRLHRPLRTGGPPRRCAREVPGLRTPGGWYRPTHWILGRHQQSFAVEKHVASPDTLARDDAFSHHHRIQIRPNSDISGHDPTLRKVPQLFRSHKKLCEGTWRLSPLQHGLEYRIWIGLGPCVTKTLLFVHPNVNNDLLLT
jgi:hypothetical protein